MLKVSEIEVKKRLAFDNPWWGEAKVDARYENYERRFYFESFYSLVTDRSINRAVILMGPRRVGKTVITYHCISELLRSGVKSQEILYISLETPIYTDRTLAQMVSMFVDDFGHRRDQGLYIFFDEIQYFKDWEIHLKRLVDDFPSYRFVATGSAAAALRLKSQESGAGRFTDFMLPPLTFAEYMFFIKKDEALTLIVDGSGSHYVANDIAELNSDFVNYLNYGGYPEAVLSRTLQDDSARFIKSDIIDKVLLRDLPSLYGISDIQELNRLFMNIAYNTGQEISLDALSKSSGVAKNTIKRYLEYLEAAFLIRRVSRIDDGAKVFQRERAFKVYLTNPSMRAALFGYVQSDSSEMGALTETAIYSQWLHTESIENIRYARWKSGEVDMVYISPGDQKPRWCVEVKWTDRPADDYREISGLLEFVHKNEMTDGMALVTSKSVNKTIEVGGVSVNFKPSAELAYTLGKNILSAKGLGFGNQPAKVQEAVGDNLEIKF